MSRRMNRELCMLAENYNPAKHRSAGMYLSEKLDGMRCIWVPHTRGMPVDRVPFANREKDKREHHCTGLWSRYGKIIHCPEWFTQSFPNHPLDGELYLGRGRFQELMSAVKELEPNFAKWQDVRYIIFDAPTYSQLFASGRINNPNYRKTVNLEECMAAIGLPSDNPIYNFDFTHKLLKKNLRETNFLQLHEQQLLPFMTDQAKAIIIERLEDITNRGGEGLILRHPSSEWEPIRSSFLLKAKKLHDAEAIVIGYKAGLGKYLGMLGALVVKFGDVIFELSGFTDEERTLLPAFSSWAGHNPGMALGDCPLPINGEPCPAFPYGSVVTFRYRELSDDAVPKEARYMRKAT